MGFLRRLLSKDEHRQAGDESVVEVKAAQVQAAIEGGEALVLVDVREAWEWMSGHIEGAIHIPMGQLPARMDELSREDELVIYCHTGQRSLVARQFFLAQGYRDVRSLRGGVESWAREIDETMARY